MKNIFIVMFFLTNVCFLCDLQGMELGCLADPDRSSEVHSVDKKGSDYSRMKATSEDVPSKELEQRKNFFSDGIEKMNLEWGAAECGCSCGSCDCVTSRNNCLRIASKCCKGLGEVICVLGATIAGVDALFPECKQSIQNCSDDLRGCVEHGWMCERVNSSCTQAANLVTLNSSYSVSIASAVLNTVGPGLLLVGELLERGYKFSSGGSVLPQNQPTTSSEQKTSVAPSSEEDGGSSTGSGK